jgi:hypothetical protein
MRQRFLHVCVECGYKRSMQVFEIYVRFVHEIGKFYISVSYLLHSLSYVKILCQNIQLRVSSVKTNGLSEHSKHLTDPIKCDEFLG